MNNTEEVHYFINDTSCVHPPDKLEENIQIYLSIILGAAIITGNSCVVCIILRTKKLHSATFHYIASLGLADLTAGIGLVLLVFTELFDWTCNVGICATAMGILSLSITASVGLYGAIVVERYVCIVYPLRRHSMITSKKVIISEVGIWSISLTLSIIGASIYYADGQTGNHDCLYFEGSFGMFALTCDILRASFIFPTIIFCYSKIVQAAVRQRQLIRNSIPHNMDFNRHHLENSFKLVKAIIFTVGLFIISWFPFFIASLLYRICDEIDDCAFTMETTNFSYFYLLGISNSLMNIFVYAFKIHDFRDALRTECKNLVRKMKIWDYENFSDKCIRVMSSSRLLLVSTISRSGSSDISEAPEQDNSCCTDSII